MSDSRRFSVAKVVRYLMTKERIRVWKNRRGIAKLSLSGGVHITLVDCRNGKAIITVVALVLKIANHYLHY